MGKSSLESARVFPAKLLDRLVGHRRPAVRVEEGAPESLAVVVLQRPHAGRQVLLRIPQARSPNVHQATELAFVNEDVRQAVVAVDQDMTRPLGAERAT